MKNVALLLLAAVGFSGAAWAQEMPIDSYFGDMTNFEFRTLMLGFSGMMLSVVSIVLVVVGLRNQAKLVANQERPVLDPLIGNVRLLGNEGSRQIVCEVTVKNTGRSHARDPNLLVSFAVGEARIGIEGSEEAELRPNAFYRVGNGISAGSTAILIADQYVDEAFWRAIQSSPNAPVTLAVSINYSSHYFKREHSLAEAVSTDTPEHLLLNFDFTNREIRVPRVGWKPARSRKPN